MLTFSFHRTLMKNQIRNANPIIQTRQTLARGKTSTPHSCKYLLSRTPGPSGTPTRTVIHLIHEHSFSMIGSITKKGPPFPTSITKEAINQLPLIEYSGDDTPDPDPGTTRGCHAGSSQGKVSRLRHRNTTQFSQDRRLPSRTPATLHRQGSLHSPTRRIQDYTPIASLFSNPSQFKAGVAIRDDLVGLMKIFPFSPRASSNSPTSHDSAKSRIPV
jgi:hypothetical protein